MIGGGTGMIGAGTGMIGGGTGMIGAGTGMIGGGAGMIGGAGAIGGRPILTGKFIPARRNFGFRSSRGGIGFRSNPLAMASMLLG